jgi:carboxypeptidase Taq
MAYFPTYTIGALAACQIYECAATQLPTLDADLAAGNFKPLKAWLNERVHRLGSLHPSGDALLEAVTGSKLDPSLFLDYLRRKYTPLYRL